MHDDMNKYYVCIYWEYPSTIFYLIEIHKPKDLRERGNVLVLPQKLKVDWRTSLNFALQCISPIQKLPQLNPILITKAP